MGVAGRECRFTDLLGVCNFQFAGLPQNKKWFRRLFILTANDLPNKDHPETVEGNRAALRVG